MAPQGPVAVHHLPALHTASRAECELIAKLESMQTLTGTFVDLLVLS